MFLERNPGVKWRLFLFALSLPLMIVAGVFIWQDYESRRDAIVSEVRLRSNQVNEQLETFVQTVEGAATAIGIQWVNERDFSPSDPAKVANQNMYLAQYVADSPNLTRASITDTSGVFRASSKPFAAGERVGTEAFYQQVLAAGKFTASDVVVPLDAADGAEPFVLFAKPLTWRTGEAGLLVLESDLATVSAALDMSKDFPTTAKSGIFDSQGRIVAGAGYKKPYPPAGRDISASPVDYQRALWTKAATRPTEEWFGLGLDKVDRIIFFGYPESAPSWITTVAYAQSELFDPLWNQVWLFVGVLLATLGFIMWVAEILVRRERRGMADLEKERVTLDAVMNGATDGIMVIDVDNNVNFTNKRFTEMLGLRPGNLVGQPAALVREIMVDKGDDPAEISAQLERAEVGDGVVVADSLSMKESVGLELEMTSYPLRQADGQPLGRTMVFHDVTQAQAVQRMKSQFLATASHQLRTPMASILAFSELSLSRDAEPPVQREWLEQIQSQSTRMTDIINSMLSVSQIESGRLDLNFQEVDAYEVCRGVVEDFKTRSEGYRFEIQIPDSLRYVRADRAQLAQILENLVDNAVKYSPDGGTVTVAAVEGLGGAVQFRVSDTGVGISAEGQKNLFVPFSRVPDDRTNLVTGTGLGLYISRNLTELHGGEMWVESRLGAGTTVNFTIQAATRPETAGGPLRVAPAV